MSFIAFITCLRCYVNSDYYSVQLNGYKIEINVSRNYKPEDLAKRILELSLGEVSFEFDRKFKPKTPELAFFLAMTRAYRELTGEISAT